MDERDTRLTYADESPTLAQILAERNPPLRELVMEQSIQGCRCKAWCHRCSEPFLTTNAMLMHIARHH
jgi:hypothetical protein